MESVSELSVLPTAVAPTASSIDVHLCPRCAAIKFKDLFDTRASDYYTSQYGVEVLQLEATKAELLASTCSLCRFFGMMAHPQGPDCSDAESNIPCHLRAISTVNLWFNGGAIGTDGDADFHDIDNELSYMLRVVQRETNNCLCEDRCGYFADAKSSSPWRVRHVSAASWCDGFAKEAINYCREHHDELCSPMHAKVVKALRVVDCRTRCVVASPEDCQYVALSYVWGKVGAITVEDNDPKRSEVPKYPEVVEDSIVVTLNLDYRYLWVDRYCIDQEDGPDKLDQIRQMDVIYNNAVATIMAAAGEDSSYGLPGVGTKTRKPQHSLDLGSHLLVSIQPHASNRVNSSKWASRAWTYQEGILSRRRLLFTDNEVSFECNGMYLAESMIQPLDRVSIKRHTEPPQMKHRLSRIFHHKSPGTGRYEGSQFIQEYASREISFPEDTINAIQGILQTYAKSPCPVFHFMGIPIMSAAAILQNPYALDDVKWKSLTAEHSFAMGLCWSHSWRGKRRPEFPSWTWAGWTEYPSGTTQIKPENVKIWVDDSVNQLTRFPSFDALPNLLLRQPSHGMLFLTVEASTITCTIASVELDVEAKRRCSSDQVTAIVVREVGEHYERIGSFTFSYVIFAQRTTPRPDGKWGENDLNYYRSGAGECLPKLVTTKCTIRLG
ncbi:hypothetical protein LHYA1_G008400 [Lachnellula hyalina]|uniref:Heterokaryon incompatibility domain-containing protein n=1 Tax=Lachnellula hyalina TaxID=1316788 RepID=A0A8H8TW15_9HELO|nr:uncharacterized protein LHYA1_G008400 [Lachnellula hyalina]TVY22810.1 hypothetical protein LHYA1_G008400 [Lachnellula hyalina]